MERLSIAGGSVAGIYYQAAVTFCTLINKHGGDDFQCNARAGSGSVFNVNALKRDFLTFGLVQSDRNWQAWNGEADWQGSPVTSLRSVFSLHDEAIHLMARADAGITSVDDLRTKRVNLGNVSSGQRGNALTVLRLHAINPRSDIDSYSYQQANAYVEFMKDGLDAFFYTVGVPSDSIAQVANDVDTVMVPLDSDSIQAYVASKPYYTMVKIPANTYRGMREDITTFGLKATMMTKASTPEPVVYELVKTVFDNFETFKKSHPAFSNLQPESMLNGLTAPLHPGAVRYYREMGWMK